MSKKFNKFSIVLPAGVLLIFTPILVYLFIFALYFFILKLNDWEEPISSILTFVAYVSFSITLAIVNIKHSKYLMTQQTVLFVASLIIAAISTFIVYNYAGGSYGIYQGHPPSPPKYIYTLHRIHPLYPFDRTGIAYINPSVTLGVPNGYIKTKKIVDSWYIIVSKRFYIWLIAISILHGEILSTFILKNTHKQKIKV